MEQFVLVPVSVYKKSLNTQSVTKQDLPKYQADQNPTNRIDSIKIEINEKSFAKADFLVDKILSFPRIKLSISQTKILDGVEVGVLLSDFDEELQRKNAEVTNIYFTLLIAAGTSPTLVLNQKAKTKDKESWIPFQIWTDENEKVIYSRSCRLWICAQYIKN